MRKNLIKHIKQYPNAEFMTAADAVAEFKAKKKYRRTQGHRQPYTKVEITKISEK